MEDLEKQLLKAQAEVGDKLTMVADGLELYNLAKDGDLNQAALYFQKKTGIHIYPAFLFRTKIAPLNKFLDDYNQARFKKLPEPYIILLYTITDTTATFQHELSPTLLAKKAKLDVLLQSKAGGFAQGGDKKKFLSGMPKLSLNLKELADQMSVEGLVDQLGMLAGDLKEAFLKAIKTKRESISKDSLGKIKNCKIKKDEYVEAYSSFNGYTDEDSVSDDAGDGSEIEYEMLDAKTNPDPEGLKLSAKHLESEKARFDVEILLRASAFLVGLITKEDALQTLIVSFEKDSGDFLKSMAEEAVNGNPEEVIVKRTTEFLEKKIDEVATKDL